MSSQKPEASQSKNPGSETRSKSETPSKLSQIIPPSSSTIPVDVPKTTRETQSSEFGIPIPSLTPIQSTFGIPDMQVIYASDLTPISREEIPSSKYFFNKKRKVVLKQEMHLREGTMVKKHKVLVDEHNLEEEDFTMEVAGSMEALTMTNLFSLDSLKTKMKKKNQMIAQLQDQIRNT